MKDHGQSTRTSASKQLRYLSAAAILRGSESVIGRSDYSTILIAHPSVSRVHAAIILRDGETLIQDLGSKNGTFVNGVRVGETPVPIDIGDTIQIGHVECTVESTARNALVTADSGCSNDGTDPAIRGLRKP